MLATRHAVHTDWAALVWIALAMAFGVLASAQLLGAEGNPPRQLPREVIETANPMTPTAAPRLLTKSTAKRLEQIVEDTAAGRFETAISEWERITLPRQAEVWRKVGIGVAELRLGRLRDADEALVHARGLDPDNPIVHYFLGVLRLGQAETSRSWPDAVHFAGTKLVAYSSPGTKSKGAYQLEAVGCFTKALALESELDVRAPLIPFEGVARIPYPMAAPDAPPSVAELLEALQAERWVVTSHRLLSRLLLDQGDPERAEAHLDAAALLNARCPESYRRIAEHYEASGRPKDAYRAYVKARQ